MKQLVAQLMDRGIIVTSDLLERLADEGARVRVAEYLRKNPHASSIEPAFDQEDGSYVNPIIIIAPETFTTDPQPFTLQGFTSYFRSRYKTLAGMLSHHPALASAVSIAKLAPGRQGAVIGMLANKRVAKTGSIILDVEDLTGSLKCMVKADAACAKKAANLTEDTVVGLVGHAGKGVLFCNDIILPDLPVTTTIKKGPRESYAIFLSDLHVGSNNFLAGEFDAFLDWMAGKEGTPEQRRIASLVRYVFIAGDLVDGVGVYPNQEDELVIKDIREQYEECARLLSRIPQDKTIVVSPGNHDYVRIAEPQPRLDERYAASLLAMPNLISVTNPAYLSFERMSGFPGFDILLYHGNSFDHYFANMDVIRMAGGYDRSDLLMRYLLRVRHLAPTYSSTQLMPLADRDPLVVRRVPDFFVTGHIHKSNVSTYRGVTMISGSCFQSTTAFQERVGHKPEPGYVPCVNLQTRQITVMRF